MCLASRLSCSSWGFLLLCHPEEPRGESQRRACDTLCRVISIQQTRKQAKLDLGPSEFQRARWGLWPWRWRKRNILGKETPAFEGRNRIPGRSFAGASVLLSRDTWTPRGSESHRARGALLTLAAARDAQQGAVPDHPARGAAGPGAGAAPGERGAGGGCAGWARRTGFFRDFSLTSDVLHSNWSPEEEKQIVEHCLNKYPATKMNTENDLFRMETNLSCCCAISCHSAQGQLSGQGVLVTPRTCAGTRLTFGATRSTAAQSAARTSCPEKLAA